MALRLPPQVDARIRLGRACYHRARMTELLALAASPAAWIALATLIAMEVVLGIDNLIFISILTNKLPEAQRARARRIGIALALILRLALLGTVAFIVKLVAPVFTILGNEFSWRDLILLAGHRIRTSTSSLQAGDDWGAPQLLVEEWLEGA